jgi:hypothetical protein
VSAKYVNKIPSSEEAEDFLSTSAGIIYALLWEPKSEKEIQIILDDFSSIFNEPHNIKNLSEIISLLLKLDLIEKSI